MTEPCVIQFNTVLTNIRGAGPINADGDAETDEWVPIWSYYLADSQLYDLLASRWDSIAWNGYETFALIYCEGGPDSGVWVHHLYDPGRQEAYACGTHVVSSWY